MGKHTMHEAKRRHRAVEVDGVPGGAVSPAARRPPQSLALWTAILLGGLGGLSACGEDDPAREAAIARAKARKEGDKPPVSAPPPAAPASKPMFRFTEKPELAKVPDVPVFGQRDGAPMKIESVVFEPRGDRWTLSFHDVPLGLPTGLIRGSLPLVLELPANPEAGARLSKPFGEGGALWRVPGKAAAAAAPPSTPATAATGTKKNRAATPASGAPSGPAAPPIDWRAPNAFVIEITQWNVAPYAEDGPAFQEAGTAAGRVAVIFKGEGTRTDSYVVGRFENALVRYMGRPDAKVAKIVAEGPKPPAAPESAPASGPDAAPASAAEAPTSAP
jgi:hypothetical protein